MERIKMGGEDRRSIEMRYCEALESEVDRLRMLGYVSKARFSTGQAVLQWWAPWFKDQLPAREHYKKKNRPAWYFAEIMSPPELVRDILYCGIFG